MYFEKKLLVNFQKTLLVILFSVSIIALTSCDKSSESVNSNEINANQTDYLVEPEPVVVNALDKNAYESKNNSLNQVSPQKVQKKTQNSIDTPILLNNSMVRQNDNNQQNNQYNTNNADASAVIGDQVTTVKYANDAGKEIKTVFYTSLTGDLSATVTLPSGQKVKLNANNYEGGNNPVYRSQDGMIEMVTYGGGGSIDFIVNGKGMQFNAMSVNAEVVASRGQ